MTKPTDTHATAPRSLGVFLCYAPNDHSRVCDLYRRLCDAGIQPWFDEEDLLPGQDRQQEIRKAVRSADAVIVCLSQQAIVSAAQVHKQIKIALDIAAEQPDYTIFLIPAKLEECELPERLQHLQAVDLGTEPGFERLLRALQRRAADVGAQLPGAATRPAPEPPVYAPNPFGQTGRIADPTHFFGRADLLRRIFEELRKGTSLALIGERQVGKSSLLAMIRALGPQALNLPPTAFIYLDMQMIDDTNDFFKALCTEIGIPPTRGSNLARVLRGQRFIVCLDEIEHLTDTKYFKGAERKQLRGLADGADAPLTLVIASSLPLDQLFPDAPGKTSPLANICRPLDVLPFDAHAARSFIEQRLRGTNVTFTESEIAQLIAESSGHPARLQWAAAEVYRRYTET